MRSEGSSVSWCGMNFAVVRARREIRAGETRMKLRLSGLLSMVLLSAICVPLMAQAPERWTEEKANAWYAQQPWLVGANFIPSNAINEFEMWQADTSIRRYRQGAGMGGGHWNEHDARLSAGSIVDAGRAGIQKTDRYISHNCGKHHIKPLFVLFDSCWESLPVLGPQHPPIPGVHNSGWVQSPGAKSLMDSSTYPHLKEYVQGVVGAFAKDDRVLGWDIWNEPDNGNQGKDEPKNKTELVAALLPQAFAWAREVHPIQPLTSGVWQGDWSNPAKMSAMVIKSNCRNRM